MLTGETFFKFFEDNPEIDKKNLITITKKMENYFCEKFTSTEEVKGFFYAILFNNGQKRIYINFNGKDKAENFLFSDFAKDERFSIEFSTENIIKTYLNSIESYIIKNGEKISPDFFFTIGLIQYCFSLKYIQEDFLKENAAEYFIDIFPKDIIVDNFIQTVIKKSLEFEFNERFKNSNKFLNLSESEECSFIKNKVEEYIKNNFDKNPQDYTEEERFYYLLKNS